MLVLIRRKRRHRSTVSTLVFQRKQARTMMQN